MKTFQTHGVLPTANCGGYDCYPALKVHWWFDYYQTDTETAMRWPSLALVCFE